MTTPMDEVVTYHCSIFENILIHNEAGAREAMMAHLSRVEELLARKVPEEKEGVPVPTEEQVKDAEEILGIKK